ncbi:MAG: hypothetical protein M3Q97_11605, partial [Bacteroidota bacterium]|nr:hypothetical protein [Bacteroidota bacterium]
MRRKLKFYFNPAELKFVHYKPSQKNLFFRIAGILTSLTLVIALTYSVIVYQKKSPGEQQLKYELSQYKQHVKYLNSRVKDMSASLSELQSRDN